MGQRALRRSLPLSCGNRLDTSQSMRTTYVIPEGPYAAAIADVVKMPIDSTKREYWVVTRINVMEKFRGQGYGTKVLDLILQDADAEGVTLFLEPVASGGLSQEDLTAWYERHGFDWGTWHMKRKPRKESD